MLNYFLKTISCTIFFCPNHAKPAYILLETLAFGLNQNNFLQAHENQSRMRQVNSFGLHGAQISETAQECDCQ